MTKKPLTVGELRKALEGVPDNLEVELSSDTGVDQGLGRIIVESAKMVGDEKSGCFDIYANDREYDWEESE